MATAQLELAPVKTRLHLWNPIGGADPALHARSTNTYIGHHVRNMYPDEVPENHVLLYKCIVEVAEGVTVNAFTWGHHVFVGCDCLNWGPWTGNGSWQKADEPFIKARLLTDKAYTKDIEKTKNVRSADGYHYNTKKETFIEIDNYEIRSRPGKDIPYAYVQIEITVEGHPPSVGEFKYRLPEVGKAVLSDDPTNGSYTVLSSLLGLSHVWEESVHHTTYQAPRHNYGYGGGGVYKNAPLKNLLNHLNNSDCSHEPDEWWARFFDGQKFTVDTEVDDKGLTSLYKRKAFKDNIARLKTDSPVDWMFFRWLHSGRTKNKRRNNTLIGVMLKLVAHDYGKLVKALQDARKECTTIDRLYTHDNWFDFRRNVCLILPGAEEKARDQDAKHDYTKARGNGKKAEGLGVTKALYPQLFRRIQTGDIPINVFKNPDGQPVNREFSLWEKALKRKGWADPIGEIARNASGRSTYEKDITPYLSYLFKIEQYLKRHTKKSWKAMPRFVNSQWDLEMDEPQGGTVKRRSAFTPVADNETRVVTVPYVAVCVTGVRSQWCYSKQYHVFEENMIDPVSGGVVTHELEKNLNGRDDYGLMYFTLTGTVTARGYPTFLIIFERRYQGHSEDKIRISDMQPIWGKPVYSTFVHFHRVHPKRSVNGHWTPACQLIEKCYQYMAGNVPASSVAAQQGDLIFIRHDNDPIKAKAKVEDPQVSNKALVFESHAMVPLHSHVETNFKLYVSTAKTPKNRLGFLHVDQDWKVQHPEHDDIERMPSGWWEIRRCRSYENNPKAIWSMTID